MPPKTNTKISVSAERVGAAGQHMDVPVASLDQTLKWFQGRLQQLGEPWGKDEIGEQWSSVYLPSRTALLQAVLAINAGLEGIGTDLTKLAELYDTEYHSIA